LIILLLDFIFVFQINESTDILQEDEDGEGEGDEYLEAEMEDHPNDPSSIEPSTSVQLTSESMEEIDPVEITD
jgi:hypothetical protein